MTYRQALELGGQVRKCSKGQLAILCASVAASAENAGATKAMPRKSSLRSLAAFLATDLGFAPEPRDEPAAYIAHWLEGVCNDKRFIFQAVAHAQKAVDYLHGLQPNSDKLAALATSIRTGFAISGTGSADLRCVVHELIGCGSAAFRSRSYYWRSIGSHARRQLSGIAAPIVEAVIASPFQGHHPNCTFAV